MAHGDHSLTPLVACDRGWAVGGVEPDLSAWGKCVANGHPIFALLGSDKARAAAAKVRATGSFWFQSGPMAAGIVTLDRTGRATMSRVVRPMATRPEFMNGTSEGSQMR